LIQHIDRQRAIQQSTVDDGRYIGRLRNFNAPGVSATGKLMGREDFYLRKFRRRVRDDFFLLAMVSPLIEQLAGGLYQTTWAGVMPVGHVP